MIFFALTYSDLYSEVVFTENIYQRPAAEEKIQPLRLIFWKKLWIDPAQSKCLIVQGFPVFHITLPIVTNPYDARKQCYQLYSKYSFEDTNSMCSRYHDFWKLSFLKLDSI